MRFEYVAYRVQSSSTIPDGIVYRPEITVRFRGPSGELTVSALIDTGADETILPWSLASILGVEPDNTKEGYAQGVTGEYISLAPAEVEIEFIGVGETYRWSTLVSFAEFPDTVPIRL